MCSTPSSRSSRATSWCNAPRVANPRSRSEASLFDVTEPHYTPPQRVDSTATPALHGRSRSTRRGMTSEESGAPPACPRPRTFTEWVNAAGSVLPQPRKSPRHLERLPGSGYTNVRTSQGGARLLESSKQRQSLRLKRRNLARSRVGGPSASIASESWAAELVVEVGVRSEVGAFGEVGARSEVGAQSTLVAARALRPCALFEFEAMQFVRVQVFESSGEMLRDADPPRTARAALAKSDCGRGDPMRPHRQHRSIQRGVVGMAPTPG